MQAADACWEGWEGETAAAGAQGVFVEKVGPEAAPRRIILFPQEDGAGRGQQE